ncbi:MAG: S46 family peptidase [Bacteroidales bacterium]|nr:S46 family peptidase [Bacteroidales bacterium]
MKNRVLGVFLFICIFFYGRCDEGMWLLNLIGELNYNDMQKLGCKLTPDQIYSINKSSLKDAIFQLMNEVKGEYVGFCTAEAVSPNGLIFTNHHCGYDAIAKLSTVERDYLTEGFWAKNYSEELPVEGLYASRIVKIEDVTNRILEGIKNAVSEEEKKTLIKKAIEKIEKEAKENTHYEAKVKEFYAGNEYYLFVFEVFKDIRLVGAPPSSIGKFGGDTDNWMWPRHTGDFCVFRIYTAPDGKPAKYNKDNIPYKPLYYLPISLKGIKPNDFTMIIGFPGQTERYLTASGMTFKRDVFNPTLIKIIEKKLNIWKNFMNINNEIRIALASEYAALANAYKLWLGEVENLRKTDVIEKQREFDKQFVKWANSIEDKKYSTLVEDYSNLYKSMAKPITHLIYISVALLQGSSQVLKVQEFMHLKSLLNSKNVDKAELKKNIEELRVKVDDIFKEYYPQLDKEVFFEMLKMYYRNIPKEEQLKFLSTDLPKKYKGKTIENTIYLFVNNVFSKSIFTDKKRMLEFLNNPKAKILNNDPLIHFFEGIIGEYQFKIVPAYTSMNSKLEVLNKKYIEALRKFQPDRKFYPDANGTMRLTYGTVQPYKPKDAVYYNYITYLDGVIEKMDDSNPEFKVSSRLVELYNKKDFGRYAENNRLPVAFISDNDITGGNSGSPVINGNGELVGIAFDGNWDWLCSNYVYNKNLQRTINVDIRYVLWVIDKFANCSHIMNELKIIE